MDLPSRRLTAAGYSDYRYGSGIQSANVLHAIVPSRHDHITAFCHSGKVQETAETVMSASANPIVLIELNEVPNVVLDAYAEHRSNFFAHFLSESDRYVTVTPDRIQLDPWIAWPTFHRGVNDEAHGLLRLGQNTAGADTKYPAVWELLKNAGVPTGVYGSLFSSCETDQSGYDFFVPDVFSPHDRVNPETLQRFQSFNLAMTRASARNASEGVSRGGARAIGELALSGRLTLGTLSRVASQLVSERFDRRNVSRRRNTQTELHADVFASLLKRERPHFSTFYTNNVAAAMHRFWSAAVPGSSLNRERLGEQWLNQYSEEVFTALFSVERLLARLRSGEFGPMTIIVASALGQEEIPAENHDSFLTVTDLTAFARVVLGPEAHAATFTSVPTMVPDFSISFSDVEAARRMISRLALVELDGKRPVETYERMLQKNIVEAGSRLSHICYDYGDSEHFKHAFTFKQSDAHTVHISLQIDDYQGSKEARIGNETFSFEQLGLGFIRHDEAVNCTAQHCAEGALFVNQAGGATEPAPMKQISILDFAPSILDYFGVPTPHYMAGETSIRLTP